MVSVKEFGCSQEIITVKKLQKYTCVYRISNYNYKITYAKRKLHRTILKYDC